MILNTSQIAKLAPLLDQIQQTVITMDWIKIMLSDTPNYMKHIKPMVGI